MRTKSCKIGLTSRLLGRGESMLAGPGASAITVILCAIAGAAAWNLYSAEVARRQHREQTLRIVAQFLAASAEQLIATDNLSQLRTIVAGAVPSNQVRAIRIALPEPSSVVVAEAGSSDISEYQPLPEKWPEVTAAAKDTRLDSTGDGRARITHPVIVPGRGVALLEIEDNLAPSLLTDWQTQLGIAAIGGASLIAMLGFYRSLRRKFRPLGAISESLQALSAGETDPGALTVSTAMGADAAAWNALIAERTQLISRSHADRPEQRTGDRRSRDGDLMGICDAMWQGLVLVDSNLRVTFVNGAGAVFLRHKREDITGKDIAPLVADQRVVDALRSVVTGSGAGRSVVEVERFADAQTHKADTVLRFSIRPVRKEDNAAAILVIEDVTQQRVAEESRHTFVASATHELRTPLTNIRLYVDTLLDNPDQDVSSRTKAINVISQEAKRLERMVSDMLSVAQIEAGTLKLNKGDVRLEPIFEDLKHDFAEQARQKDINLKFDLPPKWPQMEGDRDKIVMALHNLVGNAIKYTPAGGEVTVRAVADNSTLTVDVSDTGIGIKDDEQALVFEKFYRAKDKRITNVTGTGLGLAIARDVVRLHGGDISLQSQIDKGSTFSMSLPAKAA